jgi:hypothetical protein
LVRWYLEFDSRLEHHRKYIVKQFTLKYIEPFNDVDFLNSTSIRFDFADSDKDSGWCDAFTGARIILSNDKIIFDADEQDESVLRFKFGERLLEI